MQLRTWKDGALIHQAFSRLFAKKEMRILMVGLDAAGKTTILYKLKLGEIVTTIPTIACFQGLMWDRGIQEHKLHCLGCWWPGQVFPFVFHDRDRVVEARDELHRMLNEDELRDAVLLVFANKQDLPNAMNAAESQISLVFIPLRQRHWYIQSTCATSGEGLRNGLIMQLFGSHFGNLARFGVCTYFGNLAMVPCLRISYPVNRQENVSLVV
ncbi:hypothetical protein POTOM_061732 [Populus tomentosa]|uniref:ADP-ribosylation factor n=1 Tax=Populus tomentosa TaxID=118781 RepID=A0A8X7XXV2_POPTO|nr:hypothetical protein POTOM_061732 [Populus tomentosa]